MEYHDNEWGVPDYSEKGLFKKLSLEVFQAGLQWSLILKKRYALERAFDGFDYQKVAKYSKIKINRLLKDSSIIRNRAKIGAVIHNAKVVVKLHRKGITLKQLTWRGVHNTPLDHLIIDSNIVPDNAQFIQPYLVQFRYYHFQRIGPKTFYSYL